MGKSVVIEFIVHKYIKTVMNATPKKSQKKKYCFPYFPFVVFTFLKISNCFLLSINDHLQTLSKENLLRDPASIRTGTLAPPAPGMLTGDDLGGLPTDEVETGGPSKALWPKPPP